MPLGSKPFENTVGKGEIAHNEQFLLFPQCFLCLDNFLPFSSNLKLSSANSFSLEESKICHLVMGQLFTTEDLELYLFGRSRLWENIVGNRKCWSPAFFSISYNVFKRLKFFSVVKSPDCVVKG